MEFRTGRGLRPSRIGTRADDLTLRRAGVGAYDEESRSPGGSSRCSNPPLRGRREAGMQKEHEDGLTLVRDHCRKVPAERRSGYGKTSGSRIRRLRYQGPAHYDNNEAKAVTEITRRAWLSPRSGLRTLPRERKGVSASS